MLLLMNITSHLKIIFWPNIYVGAEFQVLEILEYVCGLKLISASILTQNLYFEMACKNSLHYIAYGDVRY